MTGQLTNKFRLVRCPKCRRVLPEVANVPVYLCGGCGTVLQAKKHKSDLEGTGSNVHESDIAQKIESQLDSGEKAAQSFIQEETLPLKGQLPVEKSCESNQNETHHCNIEHFRAIESSTEFSEKLTHHKNEVSLPAGGTETERDNDDCFLKEINEGDKNECCNQKQSRGFSLSDEEVNPTELSHHKIEDSSALGVHCKADDNNNCLELSNGRTQREGGDYNKEWLGNMKISNEVPSSTEFTCQEIEESLPVGETNSEASEEFRSHLIFASLNGHDLLGERILTDDCLSPCSEQLELSHKRELYGFDRVSSVDTLENIGLAKPSSDFSVTLKYMPRSPITRSYYAYDGSGSSCDGTEDQTPDLHLLRGRKFGERESANGKAVLRRDEAKIHFKSNYSEMQGRHWNCSSSSSEQRKFMNHAHTVGNKMKPETNGTQPTLPFYPTDHQVGYSNGIHSNDEENTRFHVPNKREYLEEEKTELLKMVHELQDQLNRTCISQGKENGKFSTVSEKQVFTCYDHQSRLSGIPFSAEATMSKHQVDHTCFRCSNQLRHSLSLYHSSPLSPQCCTGPSLSLHTCDVKSDANCQTNYSAVKQNSIKRRYSGKKLVLPVVGGAPFLICYSCSELLQIPSDFLLFGRRCHQLKCSACSIILKFSLREKTHIVRYIDFAPETVAPPFREDDEHNDANNGNTLLSVSCNSDHADPVSYSDDCGPSLCKSCSTEDVPSSNELQFHEHKRNSSETKVSANSSFENVEGSKKRALFKQSKKKLNNILRTFASVGSSTKMSKAEVSTSETEEL